MTGSPELFKSKMKTAFSEERLADLCEKIYRVAPADPATGIVLAGDVEKENAKDWGFFRRRIQKRLFALSHRA